MENNKYYTPELSEMHVGFEYESLIHTKEWIEVNYTELDQNTKYDIENGLIRCKFLDKEDIESFGFIHDRSYMFNLGQYRLHFIQPDNELDIIHIYDNESNDDTIFLGNIKNKSEFKFILTRLGICQ